LAGEQEPGVTILDGEGKAQLGISGSELALEVRRPGGIGLRWDGERRSGVVASTPWLAGQNAPVTAEDALDRIDAGCPRDRRILPELRADLTRTPAVSLADLEYALDHGRRRGVRTRMRPVRAVLEALELLVLEATDPLVSGRPADVEASAEFSVGEVGHFRLEYESCALMLHG
jgi:hypothetical protein